MKIKYNIKNRYTYRYQGKDYILGKTYSYWYDNYAGTIITIIGLPGMPCYDCLPYSSAEKGFQSSSGVSWGYLEDLKEI